MFSLDGNNLHKNRKLTIIDIQSSTYSTESKFSSRCLINIVRLEQGRTQKFAKGVLASRKKFDTCE